MSSPITARNDRADTIRGAGYTAACPGPVGAIRTGAKHNSYRRIAIAGKLGTALRGTLAGVFVAVALASAPAAHAQDGTILNAGDAVVTGFSGSTSPSEGLPAGADPSDFSFIDVAGASVQVVALGATGGPAQGQFIPAPKTFKVTASQVGQVFGTALDDGRGNGTEEGTPNAYVAATSGYGLNAVGPDANGDGQPDRIKTGQPGATWMPGQFGQDLGGGPGSIFKIDGATGEVSLFAEIALDGVANSGPGLGNLAFDGDNRQLFVTDLDTGMIFRVDMDGNVLDHFDHGVDGRGALGLEPVAFDPANRLDITSPEFNTQDPETWRFAEPRRRVYAVAYHDGRVFYSVAEGPQIWSVGLNEDGSFADDARSEIDLAGKVVPFQITDIAFGADGAITLAQRGGATGAYDRRNLTVPGQARVLRFIQEDNGAWSPAASEYAVGLSGEYRNASGGIALGNGYDAEGNSDPSAPMKTLWSTGDALLGETIAIQGLQGNDESLVRPQNAPPSQSYFADYDDRYEDAQATGQVGDVEIVPFGGGEPAIAQA